MTREDTGAARATALADVAVFARAPVAGHAKTRLIPRLGRSGAARFQELLIRRAVTTALAAGVGPVSLWCSPDCSHAFFATIARERPVRLFAQRGEDLGARMFDAFDVLCPTGVTLMIGTDCPALTAAALRSAANVLRAGDDDAVLIAAEDGGYVLVGLRRPVRSLFDAMPWGTDRVMTETRARLRQAGLRWRELEPSWDVDRPEDIDRLRASGLMPDVNDLLRRAAHPRPRTEL